MRCGIIQNWALRHNTGRIDLPVTGIVMRFDMRHHHAGGDTGHLIQFTKIARQRRIIGNAAKIAFEMPHIDRIKPHQCGKEPPIRLGQPIADQIAAARQQSTSGWYNAWQLWLWLALMRKWRAWSFFKAARRATGREGFALGVPESGVVGRLAAAAGVLPRALGEWRWETWRRIPSSSCLRKRRLAFHQG